MWGRIAAVGVAAATLIALTLSQAGLAAPERSEVIRMGKAIGKVRLGMTLPQVRRALGGPHFSVYRRDNFGARGRYVELAWELPGRVSWEPIVWQIGFRTWSRRAPLRVTRVMTTARSERAPKRIGIGSRPRDIVRAYPRAICVLRPPWIPHQGTWIVVEEPRGGMTAFEVSPRRVSGPSPTPLFVAMVMVQRRWFSKPYGHGPCVGDWENW